MGIELGSKWKQVTHITVFSSEHEHWGACALCEHLVVAVKPTGYRRQGPKARERALWFDSLSSGQSQENKINCNAKKQRPKTKVQ